MSPLKKEEYLASHIITSLHPWTIKGGEGLFFRVSPFLSMLPSFVVPRFVCLLGFGVPFSCLRLVWIELVCFDGFGFLLCLLCKASLLVAAST